MGRGAFLKRKSPICLNRTAVAEELPEGVKQHPVEADSRVPESTTLLLMLALHTHNEGQSRSRKAGFNP